MKTKIFKECKNKGICALTSSVNEGLSLDNDKVEETLGKVQKYHNQNTNTEALLSNSSNMIDALRKQCQKIIIKSTIRSVRSTRTRFGKDSTEKVRK